MDAPTSYACGRHVNRFRKDSAMAHPTLDTLLLTDDERRAARAQVEKMAYFRWQDAGSPEGCALRFWCEAELEWMKYFYVPNRRDREKPHAKRKK